MNWVNEKRRIATRLGVSLLLLLGLIPAVSSSAAASTFLTTPRPYSSLGFTEFPYSLDVKGTAGESSYTMTLPVGAELVELTGDIKSNYGIEGNILLKVNSRTVASVPAGEGGHVEVLLSPKDAVKNTVTISLTTDEGMQASCVPDSPDATASFLNGIMWYIPPKDSPATIRDFMDPGITNWVVQIPVEPTAAEQKAGLTAMSALAYNYPAPARISLAVTDEVPTYDVLTRVIRVKEHSPATPGQGEGGTISLTDEGSMLISGPPGVLSNTATTLGNPTLLLVQERTITRVSGSAEWDPPESTVTFKELGVGSLSLVGAGTISKEISVSQPFFAQPVESFTVKASGTFTPLFEGSIGRVETLWNGVLVDSQTMTSDSTEYSTSFTSLPSDTLRSNTLSIVMVYSPEDLGCNSNTLPQRLDVNVTNSTVTPTFGKSVGPGFERFPQTLDRVIPMTFGSEGTLTDQLVSAGNLVVALQALSPYQYVVDIIPYTVFVADDEQDGIVVGAGAEATNDLQSPYIVGASIRLADGSSAFTAVIDGPFALGQSYSGLYRDIALFGPVPAGGEGENQLVANQKMVRLTEKASSSPNRWAVYSEQVVALLSPDELVAISLPTRYEIPTIYPKTILLISIGGGLTLLLLILLIIWIFLRPKKRKMLPPEQEEDDMEADSAEEPAEETAEETAEESPVAEDITYHEEGEGATEEYLVPPGYYPDPFNPRRTRLWLGNHWPENEISDTEEERQAIRDGHVAPPNPQQVKP